MSKLSTEDLRFRLQVSSRITYFLLQVIQWLILNHYVFPQLSNSAPLREGLISGAASIVSYVLYSWLIGFEYGDKERYFTFVTTIAVMLMMRFIFLT
ncbi:hypothetical protein F5Y00DRAFT_232090 [Daldinia vernicosa]|uniref:uncharacterized protein n=1 Tax=Daldinia vernicosa TaxID=114800 RepID=UPI0020088CDE|nr:uncharacterized protein F5Y00DRAFT_232090 [Daldinia vernicosa]KAI0850804.1 hypothetical protein F5Y00DRAFT_232090 [Daldinia vernicosa]